VNRVRSADAQGTADHNAVFVAAKAESAPTCQSVLFEQENGSGVSIAYDELDAIAWNPEKTVLVVEHPVYHVIIDGARLDLLRDRFLKHACGSIVAASEDDASAAVDTPSAAAQPYIAQVRVVSPDAYHFGKQGQYVSGEESP
jgi:hypothetical protein